MNHNHQYRIENINEMNRQAFVSVFGGVFEASPWVAERTWEQAPFESVETLVEVMNQSVSESDQQAQLDLLCAHPELGTKKKMAATSEKEQTEAGMQERTDKNNLLLADLNKRYRRKFGFPFIVAVKGLTMELILENLQTRLSNDKDTEFNECLQQVFRIAGFRLHDLLVKE